MAKLLSDVLSNIVEFIEWLKGPRELVPIQLRPEEAIFQKEFEFENNSKIIIFCEEQRYILRHERWFNKTISIYRVYSVTNECEDKVIINKFHKKELYINNLWYFYANSNNKKRAAIKAFIDLIKYASITK